MKKLKINSLYSIACLCLVTVIYTFLMLHFDIYVTHYKEGYHKITGYIQSINISGDKVSILLKTKEKIMVTYYLNSLEEKELFLTYQLGDYLNVEGELTKPSQNTLFNGFNYRHYLKSKRIYFVLKADKIDKVKTNNNLLYSLKNSMKKRIDNSKNTDYLNTFLLGDKSLLENDIKNTYQANGVSHLLAISGMHISLFVNLLTYLLKKIGIKNNHKIVCFCLLVYAFLVNFTPSVIRASGLFILNKYDKRKVLIIMACFLLLFNPFIIYDVGFLFSFIVSGYLLFFGKLSNKFHNYFIKLLMTSLICFIVSLPITINNFFEINIMSVFFNLLFVPFVSFAIFPLCLLTFIVPWLDGILSIILKLLEMLSLFCNTISLKLIFCHIPFWLVLVYYLIITFILYQPKYSYLLIIILLIHYNYPYFYPNTITVLDVGQGDSILLEIDHKHILIDTGGVISYDKEAWRKKEKYSIVFNKTIPYLKSRGITHLDYLIFTHGDFDHIGEAINLVENFNVEKVVFNCGEFNELEQEIIKSLDNKKMPYYSCIKELNIADNKLYFLNNKDYSNENDNSSVIYTELNNYKFLFMGDAGVAVEEDIIKKYNLKDIDILKVGHHGSKTSSSKSFIEEINPKYSIISVGKNNRYGHPNDSVLDNLDNSKIYRTDIDGSVMFKIKDNNLKIETCTP